jgi:hypothetical protein
VNWDERSKEDFFALEGLDEELLFELLFGFPGGVGLFFGEGKLAFSFGSLLGRRVVRLLFAFVLEVEFLLLLLVVDFVAASFAELCSLFVDGFLLVGRFGVILKFGIRGFIVLISLMMLIAI